MARILIAIDFSDCGRAALAAGIAMAKDMNRDVRLVHAFPEPMNAPVAAGLGYQEIFQKYASQNETDEALRLTTEYADKARSEGIDVDILADARKPSGLILAALEEDDVEMLVMGSRGKSGFKKFVLGSVAADVIAKATKPVLVIPCAKA